jgi:hypothetical protein
MWAGRASPNRLPPLISRDLMLPPLINRDLLLPLGHYAGWAGGKILRAVMAGACGDPMLIEIISTEHNRPGRANRDLDVQGEAEVLGSGRRDIGRQHSKWSKPSIEAVLSVNATHRHTCKVNMLCCVMYRIDAASDVPSNQIQMFSMERHIHKRTWDAQVELLTTSYYGTKRWWK